MGNWQLPQHLLVITRNFPRATAHQSTHHPIHPSTYQPITKFPSSLLHFFSFPLINLSTNHLSFTNQPIYPLLFNSFTHSLINQSPVLPQSPNQPIHQFTLYLFTHQPINLSTSNLYFPKNVISFSRFRSDKGGSIRDQPSIPSPAGQGPRIPEIRQFEAISGNISG
jgi:hypothetical protein